MDEFNHLLKSTGAVLVERNRSESRRCGIDQSGTLLVVAVLEQLLTKIVAEWICHEFNDVRACLHKDGLDVFFVSVFKFSLEVTATMLIFAEFIETSTVGLEWDVVEPSFIVVIASACARALQLAIVDIVNAVHALTLTICLNSSTNRGRWIHLTDVVGLHVVGVWLRGYGAGWAAHRHHR